MPGWNEILNEINCEKNKLNREKYKLTEQTNNIYNTIVHNYLKDLSTHTKRNTIIYYSGWLERRNKQDSIMINDSDKNGFMAVIHRLDKTKGLDLILHTPGGDVAATESIIDYLQSIFEDNIRVIIPQLAMSGGTMIACCAKEIIMGNHSSLGPIDPQIEGKAAYQIIEEFENAKTAITENINLAKLWEPILRQYPPTLIEFCKHSFEWAKILAEGYLKKNMLNGNDQLVDDIIKKLTDNKITKSHNRHLSLKKCKEIGLKVIALEDDQKLQDKVLSVHHSVLIMLNQTEVSKVIQNNDNGSCYQISQQEAKN